MFYKMFSNLLVVLCFVVSHLFVSKELFKCYENGHKLGHVRWPISYLCSTILAMFDRKGHTI